MWLCLLAAMISSCSKDSEGPAGEGSSECWYKVTIDGETSHPNAFGLDRIALTGGVDSSQDLEVIGFRIDQAKEDSSDTSNLIVTALGLLNSKTAEGPYPVNLFTTTTFGQPGFEQWPLYGLGDPGDGEILEGVNFNLLENSEDRIRIRISGSLMRYEDFEGEVVETGLVPVDAEIAIGRSHYVETTVEGRQIGGAVCDCQD